MQEPDIGSKGPLRGEQGEVWMTRVASLTYLVASQVKKRGGAVMCLESKTKRVRREEKGGENGSVVSERRVQVRGANKEWTPCCDVLGKDCFDRMSGSRIRPTEGRRERCLIFLLAAFEATLLRAVLSLKTQGLLALTPLAVLSIRVAFTFIKRKCTCLVLLCAANMMRRVVFVGRRNAGT